VNATAALPVSTAPDRLEKALGALALVMLGFIVAAVVRGMEEWGRIPAIIWLHLVLICLALALTPVLLWRRRGTTSHRAIGYAWAAAMLSTAIASLFVKTINPGHFSAIHILSAVTIVAVPALVWAARSHRVDKHRKAVRNLIVGALLIAGFFTFPFGRLLGHWLFA